MRTSVYPVVIKAAEALSGIPAGIVKEIEGKIGCFFTALLLDFDPSRIRGGEPTKCLGTRITS